MDAPDIMNVRLSRVGYIPSLPFASLGPIIRVASLVKLSTYFSCNDSVSLVR